MDNQTLIIIAVLIVGAVLGLFAAWPLLRTRALAASATELATLRERLASREQELLKQQQLWEREIAEHRTTRDQAAQLQAQLEGERRAALERNDAFKKATEDLGEKFKALSRDALHDNNQSFLVLRSSNRWIK
jgi:DNA recombination protein RmuC